ncbi:MAG: OmpA family protein, partial [Luteibaculum sp.]
YENELPKAKIYLGEKLSDSLFKVVPHNLPVSDSLYDVGNLSFNHDYTLLAFSKCSKKSPTYYSCELFISRKKNGIWQEPEPMKQLNERGSTQTQPCFALGPDGKQMIYFVSDRSGGIGGKDIWYALQNASGGFSDPKNCGEKLNTAKDEVTPFYNNHLKTLYFSSNGIPGYGGMDIFYINGYASTWASPFNIKAPINSGADDLFYFAEDSASGYFTSNREGVNSLQGATCCDDIFRHYKKKIIEVEIEGSVDFLIPGDKEKNKVNVKLYKDLGGKKVLVKETMADDEGRYRFRVQPDEKYRIVAEKDGYLKAGKSVSTEGIKDDAKISAEQIKLLIETKQPIVIKNIYYPFDEDYLTEASKQNIDTTIFEILAANPTIQVEISSHTDWFGSDAYNQDLSLRRAQSVVNYLIQKGIPEDRLVAAGYGESRPIAPNQNPDGSDNPVGRAKNRRTEFRIVGYLPQYEEILYEE